jgi:hypothetical protein
MCEVKREKKLTLSMRYEILKTILKNNSSQIFTHPLIVSDQMLMVPPHTMLTFGFDREELFLRDVLHIKDTSFLQSQMNDRWKICTDLLVDDQIIVLPITKTNIWELLKTDSINGFYSIEVPIFNEEIDTAYFRAAYFWDNEEATQYELIYALNPSTKKWELKKDYFLKKSLKFLE